MSGLLEPAAFAGRIFDGGWQPARATADVVEPATGAVLGRTAIADAADVRAAVESAERSWPGWAAAPPAMRAAVLRRAAALLQERREEVIRWLIREGGATRLKAVSEIAAAADELWEAAALPTQPYGTLLPAQAGRASLGRRIPLGVVCVISPWNFPLLLALRSVAPALALGNAVVLKPDQRTAVSGGYAVARLFELAGLPAGVLHVLPGAAAAGSALTSDPGVAMVSFTGSTAVGREVGAVAGRGLKRVSLELGGNNALIVLDDADLELASSAGAFGAFFHQGQVCMAASRHIVHAAVAEEYSERLVARARRLVVGDPWTAPADLGPLIDAGQVRRAHRIVADSLAAGASARCGGAPDGVFYPPTVLTGVDPTMRAFTEEIFGPVAPIVVVSDDDEAVAVANDTDYGLAAAVQTGSAERGLRLASRLRTGVVHVNDQTVNDEAVVPFGGRGASGNGARHGSTHSWESYTQWQWMTVRGRSSPFPF